MIEEVERNDGKEDKCVHDCYVSAKEPMLVSGMGYTRNADFDVFVHKYEGALAKMLDGELVSR